MTHSRLLGAITALVLSTQLLSAQLGDAYVSSFNGPSSARAGFSATLTYNVCNAGPGNFWASHPYYWTDAIYINRTPSRSGATRLWSGRHWGTLFPGGCYSNIGLNSPITVTIPSSLEERTHYLGYCVDINNDIPETNNSNNCRWIAITVTRLPDYSVSNLIANPTTAAPGHSVTASFILHNAGGTVGASEADIGIYLVPDGSALSASDLVTEHRGIPIGSGASVSLSETFNVPSRVFGHFQLVVVADHLGFVVEGNENNNRASVPFRLGPTAAVTTFGTACGPLRMGATGSPVLGESFSFDVDAVTPLSPVFLTVGLNKDYAFGLPLPLDLSALGMAGCWLFVGDPIIQAVQVPSVGQSSVAFPASIPGLPEFLGLHVYAQAFTPTSGLNVLGVAASDALDALVGW